MTRTFAAAAADLLLARGPLSLEELHPLLVERGLTASKNPSTLASRLTDEIFVRRPDGRFDTAARLLAGQVFTTRLRRAPSRGVLWTYRDLDPLAALPGLPLVTGGVLRCGQGGVESWVGPDGWLPPLPDGALLGLRWDGHALTAAAVEEVPPGDADRVRDVREVLSRHSRRRSHASWPVTTRSSLMHTVVSALVEDPDLFAQPQPPLRDLLPLPEDLRPQDHVDESDAKEVRQVVSVPLSPRVHGVLARRADQVYERFPDYLGMLLCAAADKVRPPTDESCWRDRCDEPYLSDDVVHLGSWER